MRKKVKPHAVPCSRSHPEHRGVARHSAEQEPKSKSRPKYEPPKVVTYQEDEFLKQMGDDFEICPPATCKKN